MFVHLRLHTEFSVVDGTNRIDEVVKADRQPALAITDLNNLFGGVKFYKEARGAGVKPVLGTEVFVDGLGEPGVLTRIILLVQNTEGYLHLSELLARAWTQNVGRGQAQPACKLAWLQELNGGLIALSGAQAGPLGAALLQGQAERAAEVALQLAGLFPHRFYIELQRAGRPEDEPHVIAAVQLAARLKLPVVATHPVQFAQPDDFEAHEARVCISEGEILGNPRRVRRFTREQYFKSAAEMEALFADVPSAIANTVEIAKRCNLTLVLGKPQLPNFPTPNGMPIEEYFRVASFEGLEVRLAHLYPDEKKRDAERPRYVERLEFEINTILKMGFPGYFLIVGDFINWAKLNGCPVGPGRGSGAGSLVAYALKITDLDPLEYNLLFERFLNPERVSMPDFDIDFCQGNRDRVIDYVKDKYGRDAVSQIATFGTMAARAAIRDVGRVLDMSYMFCDGISKLIPNKPGKPVTIQYPPPNLSEADKEKYAIAAEPLLAARIEKEEEVRMLVELAQKLEGMTRNIGMHAGGVLIAPGKLTDFTPLYQQPGSDSAVSQYDKDDVEAVGLVKFDFLGLATLTILEIAREFIAKRHKGQEDFAFENIRLDDAPTYRLFSDGKTEAVFQFESRGMQGMLKDARPTRLEDLIALNALYRPGPMDLIPSFVARKHGREEVEYPHPAVAEMLSETYGIMVYQEQVMQTAQILGGYSLGGADLLRRAMGKKKAEEMAEHREKFRAGALATHGIVQEKADEIFDLMEKFAGYGFNKSHAAAYSLLAYHTGWLKVHYTAEFYCANMTVEMDDTDKLKVLFEDATKNFGMTFEPPDPLPLRAGDRQGDPLRARRGQGHRATRGRGDRQGPGGGRPLHQPLQLLRAHRPPAHQQAHGRGADQGRRLRRHPAEPCVAGRIDRPRLRVRGRHRSQCGAGRHLRRLRTRFGHAGARPGRSHALGREGAPDLREDRRRLLPVGPPVRRGGARGAALLQAADRRTDGQPRAAGHRRHRERPARHQRPARPAGDLQARRQVRFDRGDGRPGRAGRQPQHAQGRRTRHRQRAAAARPRRLRGALPGAAGLGPGGGALPLRQVPAGGGERQGAGHRAAGEGLPAAHRDERSGRVAQRPAGAPFAGAQRRAGGTATGRERQVLPHRCSAGQLDGPGRGGQGGRHLRLRPRPTERYSDAMSRAPQAVRSFS